VAYATRSGGAERFVSCGFGDRRSSWEQLDREQLDREQVVDRPNRAKCGDAMDKVDRDPARSTHWKLSAVNTGKFLSASPTTLTALGADCFSGVLFSGFLFSFSLLQ